MPRNSMKQNITQVVAWMKANKFMKEEPKRGGNRGNNRRFRSIIVFRGYRENTIIKRITHYLI